MTRIVANEKDVTAPLTQRVNNQGERLG